MSRGRIPTRQAPGRPGRALASVVLVALGAWSGGGLAAQATDGSGRPAAGSSDAIPGPAAWSVELVPTPPGAPAVPFPVPRAAVRPNADTGSAGISPGTRETLRWATLAGLWVTGTFGTLVAINRPTMLDGGRCEDGDPLLGEYGCGELSTVHGISAGTATVLYTATEVIEAVGDGDDRHPLVTWTHRLGIAVLPLAGILSRYPEVVGIRNEGTQDEFGEVLRTLHAGVGYLTVIAYSVSF